MFDIFPDHPVYEYPELINISFGLIWAFVLASIIAITHKVTFTGEYYPRNFFQALMLGSVVTAMVMMAVGDSLARGLGVFGAMAIIRFRTRIDDPRNVLFLFAALSSGLAVGVYGYTISFVGAVVFCIVALILHYSPFRSYMMNSVVLFTLKDADEQQKAIEVLSEYCGDYRLVNLSLNKEQAVRYQYSIALKKGAAKEQLLKKLNTIEGISQLRITVNEIEVNDY